MATTRSTTKELIEEGKELGFSGADLQSYVEKEKERQDKEAAAERASREKALVLEAEEKEKDRQAKEAEMARQERATTAERETQEREQARRHERDLKEMELKILEERNRLGGDNWPSSPSMSPSQTNHSEIWVRGAMSFHMDKFTEGSDQIDVYLNKFERMAKQHQLPRDKWALKVSQGLSGAAYDVYSRLPTELEDNYDALKQALLRRFHLNAESYRKKFRTARRSKHESYEQFADRLRGLLLKWGEMAEVDKDRTGLEELVILEQVRETFTPEMRVFTAEHGASNLTQALELADRYLLAHEDTKTKGKSEPPSTPRPTNGHAHHASSAPLNKGGNLGVPTGQQSDMGTKGDSQKRFRGGPTCEHCHRTGHTKDSCWTAHPELRPKDSRPSGPAKEEGVG